MPQLHKHFNVSSQVALDELVLFIEQKHPDLNILINNAAVQYNYNFMDEPNIVNKADYEISANLTTPVKLTALLLPVLLKNNPSTIVNVSSGLAISPKMTAPVYCATKAAIHSFTKALRYQLQDTGIKVFEIIPPIVETPMTEGRGKSKISVGQLANEFLANFSKERYESYIGKAKLLRLIHRISPLLADAIMKKGL